MTGAACPVAAFGREIAKLNVAITETDLNQAPRARRLQNILQDRLDGLENVISETRASSLEGAMVQVMLLVDILRNCVLGESLDESIARTGDRLAHSIVGCLEAASGTPRGELGGSYYLPLKLDPHAILCESLAKTTVASC